MKKNIAFFSILLLTSCMAHDEQTSIDTSVSVAMIDTLMSQIPGKVLKYDATRSAIDWSAWKEEGYDAILFDHFDTAAEAAKEMGYKVGTVSYTEDDKTIVKTIVAFEDEKYDEIMNKLNS